jgi:hypothetical protein
MSAYQYVVFPRGRQPTTAEVAELQRFAGALANHFAWGTCRHEPRLAIAFEHRGFDHVRQIDPGFELLIAKWQAHGCELLNHLEFVKDPSALRPVRESALPNHDLRGTVSAMRNDERIAAKELAAKEAVGCSLLSVERTLQRYAIFERFGAALPYLLMGFTALVLLATGLYARQRLLNADREPRQETIDRVLDDPLRESLLRSEEPTE